MTEQPNPPAEAPWWRRVATRVPWRRVVTRDLLVLAGLAGLALTQPLLDLFGRNPEFFVAQDATGAEIVLFALVVTFLTPIVCLVIELVAYAVGDRTGRITHRALVAVLAATLGLSVAGHLGAGDTLTLAIAVGVGLGVTVATMRVTAVETLLRYLSGALILFLVSFLFFSPSGALARSGEATAAEGVRVGNPAPVVIVQFDEFPLASVLGADGRINAERFPNFARLADQSSWFRNATAVSSDTTLSVPSAITGKLPPALDALPTSASHPENLFTLLAGDYRMRVDEPVTDLCPSAVCGEETSGGLDVARTRRTLGDAGVVLGHLTLPPFLAQDLPAVDRSWGGFLEGASIDEGPVSTAGGSIDEGPVSTAGGSIDEGPVSTAGGSIDGTPIPPAQLKWLTTEDGGRAPTRQAGTLERQIDAIEAAAEPTLSYSHVVFPHTPWALDSNGLEFAPSDDQDTPGMENGVWTHDEWFVRQGFQRHLLQLGYADTLIGRLIDQMERVGVWEDALVVVMADHGISFGPGALTRAASADTVHEIYNVPLFVKAPGTTDGEVRDDNALLIDVLPSIVDLLDIEVDWAFDGRSLFGDGPEPDTKPTVSSSGPTEVPVAFEGVMDVVWRNLVRLPHGTDRSSIVAVGENGDLIGRPVADLDVVGDSEVRWSVDQDDTLADWRPDEDRTIPLLWHGSVTMPDGGAPPPGTLAVVNDRVAGVLGGFGLHRSDIDEFSTVVTPDVLVVGENEISLLVPVDGGRRFERTVGPGGGQARTDGYASP